ncbi:MAG: hypothetical protein CL607_11360 [Anaerolineaceae bacterium]|nr:hypothetical protein [Anaerolineaceae bacterium]
MSVYIGKSPQSFLDAMHAADIPHCFVPNMTRRQRQIQIRYAKESLTQIESDLKHQIEQVKKHRDAELNVVPYERLLKLMQNASGAIANLESRLEAGKMLPRGVKVPEYIFGSIELNVWYFGSEADRKRFELMEQLKVRLEGLLAERGPLREEMQAVRTELDVVKKDLQRQQKAYQRRRRWQYALTVMLIYVMVIAAMFVVAAMTSGLLQMAAIGLGVGLLLLLIPLLFVWRKDIRKREAKLKDTQQQAKEVARKGRILQSRYTPLNEMCEEVHYQYTDLRKSFK